MKIQIILLVIFSILTTVGCDNKVSKSNGDALLVSNTSTECTLQAAFLENTAYTNPSSIKKQVEEIVEKIDRSQSQLNVKNTMITFNNVPDTPLSIWYCNNAPVKITLGAIDDSGKMVGEFKYYLMDATLWYSDQIYTKYIFKNKQLKYLMNENWELANTSSASLAESEQRLQKTINILIQSHVEIENADVQDSTISHENLEELNRSIKQLQPKTIFDAYDEMIPKVIAAFRTGNKRVIAATVLYPFEMSEPVADIKNEAEMLIRFDEVFDTDIIQEVGNSSLADWKIMGAKGIMFKQGSIWATDFGKLFRIRADTLVAKAVLDNTLQAYRLTLHPSLREFKEVRLEWTLERFKIRIDDLGEKGYRYAAWPSHKSQLEQPDIILEGGTVHYEGSAGYHSYEFKNGKYNYSVYVGFSQDDSSGSLNVSKGDESIFHEKYFEN
jgi:hypothetical protein